MPLSSDVKRPQDTPLPPLDGVMEQVLADGGVRDVPLRNERRFYHAADYMVPTRDTLRKKGGLMGHEGGSLLVPMASYTIDPSRNMWHEHTKRGRYFLGDMFLDTRRPEHGMSVSVSSRDVM